MTEHRSVSTGAALLIIQQLTEFESVHVFIALMFPISFTDRIASHCLTGVCAQQVLLTEVHHGVPSSCSADRASSVINLAGCLIHDTTCLVDANVITVAMTTMTLLHF